MHPKTLQLVASGPGGVPPPVRYEHLVRDALAEALEGALGETIPVHHDRKYTGKSGHAHQIDVSATIPLAGIEIFFLVECKFYSRSVSVDEVLEFASRIEDLSAHKGVLVAASGFQEGARKVAASKGVSLLVFNHEYPSWAAAAGVGLGGAIGGGIGLMGGMFVGSIGLLVGGAIGGLYGRYVSNRSKMASPRGLQQLLQLELESIVRSLGRELTRRSIGAADESEIAN